ncbi:exonuclease subunit SbcD [Shimwellia pseudoproteus]|uniref:exonuclease subunit SbcD n=1 Tax=Shimwellia pseudoproteus TaxID=570012 RepID=UPI0018EB449D|nr:exonuclease subunit SbcD [Shimwellia pseudoproteus]MBJ3814771.1 exonuclease subunit SbcD [Shimwellia pseudoproteus]
MRLIHTSDWHLGQNFYTKSRAAEHSAFLDWLLETVTQQQIDAIIVAGDIFDTGAPPSYARECYNRFVVNLRQTGCPLYILGGNHDGVATLNESRDLLACLNTHVIASARQPEGEPCALEIPQRDGTPGAILCPIPFLRPRDILHSQAGQSAREKHSDLLDAITGHYQHCYQAAVALRGERPLPIIMTGHLTTVGATTSDAVRDIYIGTLDAFPASHFPPADYIALGHIHRAQAVGGSQHIWYSGAPIALSFDETGPAKSVNLVTFEQGKLAQVTPLAVPVTQPLATLRGTMAQLTDRLSHWQSDPALPPCWLDIEINSSDYLHDVQRQIREITAPLPVEVLLVRRSREQRQQVIASQHSETLSELSVSDVFERRLDAAQPDDARRARLRTLFACALESLNQQEDPA